MYIVLIYKSIARHLICKDGTPLLLFNVCLGTPVDILIRTEGQYDLLSNTRTFKISKLKSNFIHIEPE